MTSDVDTRAPRSALVTGATSGLGRAAALRLAADGRRVLVHGRDAGRGAAVVQEIETNGGSAEFLAADLTDVAAIERLAAAAVGIDVLVWPVRIETIPTLVR